MKHSSFIVLLEYRRDEEVVFLREIKDMCIIQTHRETNCIQICYFVYDNMFVDARRRGKGKRE